MKLFSVIPGRREAASPESIFTNGGYGFRTAFASLGFRNDTLGAVKWTLR